MHPTAAEPLTEPYCPQQQATAQLQLPVLQADQQTITLIKIHSMYTGIVNVIDSSVPVPGTYCNM